MMIESENDYDNRVAPTKIDKDYVEYIRAGIAAYDEDQQYLLDLIEMYEPMPDKLFDKLFRSDFRDRTPRPLCPVGISGDSFILGGLSEFHSRDWWLDLAHHMYTIKKINVFTKDGTVYYERT